MDVFRESFDVAAAIGNLPIGLWLASLAGSWGFAVWGLRAGLGRGRRLVLALRWGTVACIVELMGLVGMVFIDNPERWRPMAWVVSLAPVGLAMLAVLIASARGGDERVRVALDGPDGC